MLYNGDCLEVMKSLPDNSIDACVTDPPYGLFFMERNWDKDVASEEIWREVFRILKPGAHLLSFAGTRTFHKMTTRIESAGFEIRDMLCWLYGSGFPKGQELGKMIDKQLGATREKIGEERHQDIRANGYRDRKPSIVIDITAPATHQAKEWNGWNTALKPAVEPITLARKPLSENSIARNVLKHRTGALNIDGCRIPTDDELGRNNQQSPFSSKRTYHYSPNLPSTCTIGRSARYPANVVIDGTQNDFPTKYFYCAKASTKERGDDNMHPTVKPIALMRWLLKLITPPNGTVIDPFMGSGTTGVAAGLEGFEFIGIEREFEYFQTAKKRIEETEMPIFQKGNDKNE